MSLSISATAPVQPADTAPRAPAATNQTPQPQPSADTVTLSEATQVIQLNQQGQRPSEIAAYLGIPVATVESDLGIAGITVTPSPAAAPVAASAKTA